MVQISGKTVYELEEMTSLGDQFMFLGCNGVGTAYSTYKVAYDTLKSDLSDVFMEGLAPDLSARLATLESYISVGDGSMYLQKNADVVQQVAADATFAGQATFTGQAAFKCPAAFTGVSVSLPKDSFVGSGASDAARLATSADVSAAVQGMAASLEPMQEQIMNLNWQPYLDNGVAIVPQYANKNYRLDGTFSDVFYRYAGIKQDMSGACSEDASDEREDGVVFKQIANKYSGVPLTKSYRDFRTLTVVYLEDATPTSSVGNAKKLHSLTVQTAEIDLARQYAAYKARYNKVEGPGCYFDNVDDRWYFGGNSGGLVYLSLKVLAEFNDRFLPLMFGANGHCVVAVFGRT